MNISNTELLPLEQIVPSILIMRGQLVLLDSDLASFYGMTSKLFHERLKQSFAILPTDFMFQLSAEEVGALAAQFVTLDSGDHASPYAFTEHGAFIAAMHLDSPRALDIGTQVVRAFVQMRSEVTRLLASKKELAQRVVQLERRFEQHEFVVGLLQTFCDLMRAPGALHLTQAQQADLDRRLHEYERSRGAG
jgi:hypothetical protein